MVAIKLISIVLLAAAAVMVLCLTMSMTLCWCLCHRGRKRTQLLTEVTGIGAVDEDLQKVDSPPVRGREVLASSNDTLCHWYVRGRSPWRGSSWSTQGCEQHCKY